MINYEEYTKFLSAKINRTITAAQERKLDEFESAAPKKCPRCGGRVWSMFEPARVAHDVENCKGK